MKSLAMLAVVGSALASPAREARAALIIAFEITGPGGAPVVRQFAVDQNPPTAIAGYTQINETTALPGQVGILTLADFTPIPGYTVSGSVQTQTVASGAPGSLNILDTSALSITNNTGGEVIARVAISGTDFRGPIQTANSSGSITWENAVGSSINAGWYDDPQNRQGADAPNAAATDTPGVLVHSWLDTATSIADSGSTSGTFAVTDPANFSMSLGFTLTTIDADNVANNGVFARVVNRGQTEIKAVVPEPSSVAMAGLMTMAGLGIAWRRRRAAA